MDKVTVLKGTYTEAKVFTDQIEDKCREQIVKVCSQEIFADRPIRIMPDCHFGKGCVVGFTMPVADAVVPNIVGVDIGCGMLYAQIPEDVDVRELDMVIKGSIPAGMQAHAEPVVDAGDLLDAISFTVRNRNWIEKSVGTLGGGNHFISVERGETGTYLIIHTGSRNLGKQVCEHHQQIAVQSPHGEDVRVVVDRMKAEGRSQDISLVIKELKKSRPEPDLCYLTGENMAVYLRDMQLSQQFADLNRTVILKIICREMGWPVPTFRQCIHNYISADGVIRKGAVSAKAGEMLLIPLNMRDGSLLCQGKGNADWNQSAPHGAGRVMSRNAAFKSISMEEFRQSMEGIYSTSVEPGTRDEAPSAYKKNIEAYIDDTVTVLDHLKPLYNFKAKETRHW